jgi:crotonobetaine/carnitine-CoA ligase
LFVRGVPGVSLMAGYLDDEEATRAAIDPQGWLRTGDALRRDADGTLYYVNRVKDMIKRGAENIASSEVERVLLSHPAVADAAVVGVPDRVMDEEVIAFIILREGTSARADDLRAHCAAHLSKFKVPTRIFFRDTFPRSTLDKINKAKLREEACG